MVAGSGLGKYRILVLSVAMFLLFDLGVLVLNFFISAQIEKDALSVNLAGRQRMLSQRTAKVLMQLEDRVAINAPADDLLKELKDAFELYDSTLEAFRDGKEVEDGRGDKVFLPAVKDQGAKAVHDAIVIWRPYHDLIEKVLNEKPLGLDIVSMAVGVSVSSNIKLLDLMNDLTNYVEKVATSKANKLRMIQVGGISLATLNFLVLLFHFIRQLRNNDRALEKAHQETERILQTVGEGLFLMDRGYIIGSEQSSVLGQMLGRNESLAGMSFLDLLRPLVPEKILNTAKDYLDLLFGEHVNERLVSTLNPLDEVEINLPDQRGGFISRFLEFRFKRVRTDGKHTHLLVTLNDITRRVQLERELQASQERAQGQVEMLLEMLHLEPQTLREFMSVAQQRLQDINQVLKEPTHDHAAFQEKVRQIFKLAHAMKGDSAALGLKALSKLAHELEETLSPLRERLRLTGEDFLPVTVRFEQLHNQIENMNGLLKRLQGFAQAGQQAQGVGDNRVMTVASWSELAKRIAERMRKRVRLVYQGEDFAAVPTNYRQVMVSIVNQLVRNAVVHGIEAPELRSERSKNQEGEIRVVLHRNDQGGYVLSVRDDGEGISLARLRQKAVLGNWMKADEAAHASERQLLGLLFEPAFSTAEGVTEDAGRGVGLDYVRDMLRQLGGHVRVTSDYEHYCQFTIELPPNAAIRAA